MNDALAAFVKAHDPVRYYSVLFAPAQHRHALLSLYAFDLEIQRIPSLVSEPALAEIRMQWWCDGLLGERRAEVSSHPHGAALFETCDHYQLPLAACADMIDLRRQLVTGAVSATPDEADLEQIFGHTHAILFKMAGIVLSTDRSAHLKNTTGLDDAAGHAGMVMGVIEALRAHRFDLSRIDLRDLARHHLAKARDALASLAPDLRPAFLPLVIAAPVLDHIHSASDNEDVAFPALWRVLLRMVWARI